MKNRKLRKRLMLFAGMLSLIGKPDMRVEALKKRDWNLEDQGDDNNVGGDQPDGNAKEQPEKGKTGAEIATYACGTIFLLLVGGVIGKTFWKKRQWKDIKKQLANTKMNAIEVATEKGSESAKIRQKEIGETEENGAGTEYPEIEHNNKIQKEHKKGALIKEVKEQKQGRVKLIKLCQEVMTCLDSKTFTLKARKAYKGKDVLDWEDDTSNHLGKAKDFLRLFLDKSENILETLAEESRVYVVSTENNLRLEVWWTGHNNNHADEIQRIAKRVEDDYGVVHRIRLGQSLETESYSITNLGTRWTLQLNLAANTWNDQQNTD